MPLDFTPCKADPRLRELGIHRDKYAFDFVEVSRDLQDCYDDEGYLENENKFYDTVRELSKVDLFFLMYFVLDFPMNDPFLVARCYEIQNGYDNTMNLWARGHWKSTIITHGLPLYLLINDPERRICIFSHTRNIAKDHMRRSKIAMEQNQALKMAHTDIFYEKPDSQAPKWNEDIGCYVKRKRSYIEASLEAWGLVDNLPTGKHYTHSIYDDVIDLKKVSTPEQIKKATFFFRSSLLLRARKHERVIAGTRYDNGDTYAEEMKKKSWQMRIYPAEVDEKGEYKREGTPVYLTRKELEEYWDEHGPYIYNSQMGQNPVGEAFERMQREWLRNSFYDPQAPRPDMYLYGLVDAARKQEKRSDYTVMLVIGTDCLRNFWVLDAVRDKMDNGGKWEELKRLTMKWGVIDWGYEHIGLASDREYMELRMQEEGLYFRIIELGGNAIKTARIKRLIPDFSRGRWRFPEEILYKDVNDNIHELIKEFLTEEYDTFPYAAHDDFLDCMSRIYDGKMQVIFPPLVEVVDADKPVRFDPLGLSDPVRPAYNWMAEA